MTGNRLNDPHFLRGTLSRRNFIRAGAISGIALSIHSSTSRLLDFSTQKASAQDATPALADSLTIDLLEEPKTLDPALTYDANGWSIVHSVYDSLLQYSPDGTIENLLAESFELIDPTTYEIKLRQGITFHDGTPFDAASVAASVAHIQDETVASQVRQDFLVIQEVQQVDPTTVRFVLTASAPWLPSLIAAYLVMLPPNATADSLAANPVGTGPFAFAGWERGQQISLTVNANYPADSPKGRPVATNVAYRFVPEASTRVADLLSGTASLIRNVPPDQIAAIEDGGAVVTPSAVAGVAFIRVPTDIEPFTDPQVRQALNFAVDVQAIIDALQGGYGHPVAALFPEGGLGYDPNLAPYTHDPDQAKQLLEAAGYKDGFETAIDVATVDQQVIAQAIAGMLEEVGVTLKINSVDLAVFNGSWKDPEASPLRLVTWRPLFDPYSLLGLVVSNKGFLSRYDNPDAQTLIDAAAIETDPAKRADLYVQLAKVLHDNPAAIYLYDLTAIYGNASDLPPWTPLPNEYVLPTNR